jgi:hypothetical protein
VRNPHHIHPGGSRVPTIGVLAFLKQIAFREASVSRQVQKRIDSMLVVGIGRAIGAGGGDLGVRGSA